MSDGIFDGHEYSNGRSLTGDNRRFTPAEPSPEPEAAPERMCNCGKSEGEHKGRSKLCPSHLFRLSERAAQPEAAPASEAQAPAAPDDDHSDQAERDAEELANTYYKPHRFGDGPAWYAACVAACRELAQLRARVAILDAQEVELPPLDYGLAAQEQCDERERQLLDALRAVRAWREVAQIYRNMTRISPESWTAACAAYDALAGKGGK